MSLGRLDDIGIFTKEKNPKGIYKIYYRNKTLNKDILLSSKENKVDNVKQIFNIKRSEYINKINKPNPFGIWFIKLKNVKCPIYNFKT